MKTQQELDTIEHLDFEETRECESVHHDTEPRTHDGEATHLQVGLCEHSTGLRCLPWVTAVQSGARSFCEFCDVEHVLRFIPLDNT